jgi:hypothetical protein
VLLLLPVAHLMQLLLPLMLFCQSLILTSISQVLLWLEAGSVHG